MFFILIQGGFVMKYISVKHIASKCNISVSSVYRLMKNPSFPAKRQIGRSARWVEAEVIEFLETMRTPN